MTEIRCTAIMLAAGKGLRIGGDVRKQYLQIGGMPLFLHSVRAMQDSPCITDIAVIVPEGDETNVRSVMEHYHLTGKLRCITAGGSERFLSVAEGLQAIRWPCDYVFIHDCARPFLDQEMIERLFAAVQKEKACVAAVPSKDTVRITDESGYFSETPRRSDVWIIQTPQVFDFSLILEAHRRLTASLPEIRQKGIQITDDAMVAEYMMECRIRPVMGSYRNIKVTTPEDLLTADAFFRNSHS